MMHRQRGAHCLVVHKSTITAAARNSTPRGTQQAVSRMLALWLASVASLGAFVDATELFDRNLAYSSPFTNAPHVSVFRYVRSVY